MSGGTSGATFAVVLFGAAVASAWIIGPRGPLSWDTFGYVTQALTGQVGGLGLGRPVFIGLSHTIARLWLRVGGSVWSVEPLLRYWWLAVSATAAPATMRLAQACGLSRRAAWIAGLLVALSPAFAQTADNVLTDGPAAACVVWSIVLGAGAAEPRATITRATMAALLAGACFGVACGLRETSAWFALSGALLLPCAPRGRRVRLAVAFITTALVVLALPMAIVLVTQPGYPLTIAAWLEAMARERAAHTYALRDFAFYLMWLVTLGPVALAAAAIAWTRRLASFTRFGSVSLAVCLPSLVQLATLAFYQDITYGPRYLVAAFPGALAIPAALVLDRTIASSRRRTLWLGAGILLPVLIAAPIVHAREAPLRHTIDALPAALLALPPHSLVVTGQPCPAIGLIEEERRHDPAAIGRVADWQPVCPGWGWPSDLAATLDRARAHGNTVVLDLRRSSWPGTEQPEFLTNVAAYAARHDDVIAWRDNGP